MPSFCRAIFFLCIVRTWFCVRCATVILGKRLHILNTPVSAIENFYSDTKSVNTLNKWRQTWYSRPSSGWFWKNPYRRGFDRAIFFLRVTRTWFNVRCVTLILEKLSHTLNIPRSAIEIFLLRHAVSQHLCQGTLYSTFLGVWSLIFQKSTQAWF